MMRIHLLALVILGSLFQTALAGIALLPSVATNADLKLVKSTAYNLIIRRGFAVDGDAPPLTYKSSNAACSLNSGNGDNGSQVKAADSKCWLAVFPSSGVDFRQFGADPTGLADSRAAINAAFALGSNQTYICAPGTYLIGSTAVSNYPLVAGAIGLNLSGTSGTHLANIKVRGDNCVITAATGSNNSNWWQIDYIDNLSISGVTFQANKTGLVSASPSMMILYHLTKFDINVRSAGDWGGESALDPAVIRGDWLIDGTFTMGASAVGQCYDLAFLRGVRFVNSSMVGAGTAGGASAFPCISIAYDSAMQTNYPSAAPYNFAGTRDVTIGPGNIVRNFGQGILIRAGQNYTIIGNTIRSNPGSNNGFYANGSGVLVMYESAACCDSGLDPVVDVTVAGGNVFADNGATVAGAGITIDTHLSVAANFSQFDIVGNYFSNNANSGIAAPATAFLTNIYQDANGFSGASQTTTVAANILKSGHPPLAWTPVDASGATLSFSGVSAQYALHDTKASISFSFQYPATASGANAVIGGLPYLVANALYGYTSALCFSTTNLGFPLLARANQNTQGVAFYNGSTGANVTNAQLTGDLIQCALTYPAL